MSPLLAACHNASDAFDPAAAEGAEVGAGCVPATCFAAAWGGVACVAAGVELEDGPEADDVAELEDDPEDGVEFKDDAVPEAGAVCASVLATSAEFGAEAAAGG